MLFEEYLSWRLLIIEWMKFVFYQLSMNCFGNTCIFQGYCLIHSFNLDKFWYWFCVFDLEVGVLVFCVDFWLWLLVVTFGCDVCCDFYLWIWVVIFGCDFCCDICCDVCCDFWLWLLVVTFGCDICLWLLVGIGYWDGGEIRNCDWELGLGIGTGDWD